MAQIVQPDRRRPGLADRMVEAAGQEIWVQRRQPDADNYTIGRRAAYAWGFESPSPLTER